MHPDPGAARLGRTERAHDQPRIDPSLCEQAAATHLGKAGVSPQDGDEILLLRRAEPPAPSDDADPSTSLSDDLSEHLDRNPQCGYEELRG